MFDLAGENNVPTWFSTVLLSGTAIAIALVAMRAGRAGNRTHDGLAMVGARRGVAFISLLEDASLFERAIAFTSAGRRFRGAAVVSGARRDSQ